MRLIQVAQYASDLQRAAAFYSQLLAIQPTAVFDPPGLLFFDVAACGCCWSGEPRGRFSISKFPM